MQLFQLAKQELQYIARLSKQIGERTDGAVLCDIDIPLKHFEIAPATNGLTPGEDRTGRDGLDLRVAVSGEEKVDRESVKRGIEDFVYSALYFAFNPCTAGGREPAKPLVTVDGDPDKEGRAFFHIRRFDPQGFQVRCRYAGERIDVLEQKLFADWSSRGMPEGVVQKCFASQEERERVEHLFCCMAQAFGLTQEEVNDAFFTPPDAHSIVAHKEFIDMLADLEQTMEVSTKQRRR